VAAARGGHLLAERSLNATPAQAGAGIRFFHGLLIAVAASAFAWLVLDVTVYVLVAG
jgi:hypothetical protein